MGSAWSRFLARPVVLLAVTSSMFAVACFTRTESVSAQGPARILTVQVEGVLEHLHEDWPTESRNLYFLKTMGGERLSLHFAAGPPSHLLTGHRIRVRGRPVGQTLTLDPGALRRASGGRSSGGSAGPVRQGAT